MNKRLLVPILALAGLNNAATFGAESPATNAGNGTPAFQMQRQVIAPDAATRFSANLIAIGGEHRLLLHAPDGEAKGIEWTLDLCTDHFREPRKKAPSSPRKRGSSDFKSLIGKDAGFPLSRE